MLEFETFFAFSFVCTFAVALLATGWRYLPMLVALHRLLTNHFPENYQSQPQID